MCFDTAEPIKQRTCQTLHYLRPPTTAMATHWKHNYYKSQQTDQSSQDLWSSLIRFISGITFTMPLASLHYPLSVMWRVYADSCLSWRWLFHRPPPGSCGVQDSLSPNGRYQTALKCPTPTHNLRSCNYVCWCIWTDAILITRRWIIAALSSWNTCGSVETIEGQRYGNKDKEATLLPTYGGTCAHCMHRGRGGGERAVFTVSSHSLLIFK